MSIVSGLEPTIPAEAAQAIFKMSNGNVVMKTQLGRRGWERALVCDDCGKIQSVEALIVLERDDEAAFARILAFCAQHKHEEGLMPGWGQSWTDNKMFKLEEEKRRQQKVVKQFIAEHPEYDPQNDDNNKALVDFIEASNRPFTTETIEWAYESLKLIIQPKKKNIFQKISTALNNSNMSVDPTPEVAGYMSVNVMGKEYNVPYYSNEDVKTIKQGTYFSEEQIKDEILELAAVMEKVREPVIAVDAVPHPVYDKAIAPTKTQRRIKDDDD